ncbi:cytochrome c biogenesis protein CcsA [Pontibacter sp. G13]|uniref:cytochrome c biogenesis protein n=1 Tax=Pontibacter sp. G13 TaxID=3074898 RepID=UPI00288A8C07|nr:cytochrome c biogenesis protein CcsA [Pontibacter sp. G13]WNJ17432.1 cytochrome c biogenesis protein CcsA [Pontibacter sp. G13]
MSSNKVFSIGYKALAILLVGYALIGGLTMTLPELPQLEQSSRVMFYHVPMWFALQVLMAISLFHSIRLLRLLDPDNPSTANPMEADIKAREAAYAGVIFNILGLLTGIIWSRVTWGAAMPATNFSAWWGWDPTQVSALIALLIYLAYFLLRRSFTDEEQRAKVSAVYNIFAFATLIPLFFIIPKVTEGLHPTAGKGSFIFDKSQISNEFRMILYPGMLGFILLGLWLNSVRTRISLVKMRWDNWQADRSFEQTR